MAPQLSGDWQDWAFVVASILLLAVGVNAYLNDEALWLWVVGIVLGLIGLAIGGLSVTGQLE